MIKTTSYIGDVWEGKEVKNSPSSCTCNQAQRIVIPSFLANLVPKQRVYYMK